MTKMPPPTGSVVPRYLQTIIMQWLLFGFVVFGLRRSKTPISEVMGREWKSFDEVIMDVALAGGTFIASIIIRALIVVIVLRPFAHSGAAPDLGKSVKALESLAPHTPLEFAVAMLLALTAGVVEEFIFRGYLQRQFIALTNSTAAGIGLSVIVFTLGHLYQQALLSISFVALLGLMLALLAHYRKNLRPGIMLHFGQDAIGLALLGVASKLLPR